jgi:hypothetical protein
MGARATPTLMAYDASGIIRKSWVGRLTPEEEAAVRGYLRATSMLKQ